MQVCRNAADLFCHLGKQSPWITSRLDAPQTPFWGGVITWFSPFFNLLRRDHVWKTTFYDPPPGSYPTGCAFQRLIRPRAWRTTKGLISSLCSLCPLYSFVPLLTAKGIGLDFSSNSASKWFRFVKTIQIFQNKEGLKCQNDAGMSECCRFILSK